MTGGGLSVSDCAVRTEELEPVTTVSTLMEPDSVSRLGSHAQSESLNRCFAHEPVDRLNGPDVFIGEDIVVDEIAHLPPFEQTVQYYRGAGHTLRDAVIRRQSTRTFPTDDILLQRMEDQLVRWSPPQSSFKVDDILNDRHAYQRPNMPKCEVLGISGAQDTADSDVEGSVSIQRLQRIHDELRTSSVGPSSMEPSSMGPPGTEPYGGNQRLSTIDEDPLVEATTAQLDQLARSPSISSSMLQRLTAVKLEDSAQDAVEQSPLTIEAFPISDEDIRALVKDQPTAHQDMVAQRCVVQCANGELASEPLFCDELSLICSEMWLDCWACLSCNCQSIDEDTRALYLSHRPH